MFQSIIYLDKNQHLHKQFNVQPPATAHVTDVYPGTNIFDIIADASLWSST